MLNRTMVASILALQLAAGLALAAKAKPAAAPKPARPGMEQMLPASAGSAVFVNVKRIFKLYGPLIEKAPQYAEVKKLIAQGLPDPAKDIDEVGLSIDLLKASSSHSGGGVVTGRLNTTKLLALAAVHKLTFTPSLYRGVPLLTAVDPTSKESAQLGLVDEETTIVSMDKEGKHETTKAILAVLQGEAQSFGAATGSKLPKDYLALASVQITPEMIAQFGSSVPPQFEVATHIRLVSLSISAKTNGDGAARLAISCDTEEATKALVQLLEQLRESFGSSRGRGTDVLSRLKVTTKGKTATLEVSITKTELEEIVAK